MQYNSEIHAGKELARDTLDSNILNAVDLAASYQILNNDENLISSQGEKSNSTIILDALPRRYDFPALRTSIDKVADISGVAVTGFDGDDQQSEAIKSEPDPFPIEIPFSVTVEGKYSAVNQFIENLDNSIRPMKIVRLQITGSDNSIKATLDVLTYYQPETDLSIRTKEIK